MHAHLLRFIRTGLMNPYTIYTLFLSAWLFLLWFCYHHQSLIALLILSVHSHMFFMINNRMCHAGYFGENPFKGGRK